PLSVDEQLPRGGRELLDDPVDGDSHEVPHLLHIGSHNETTRLGPSQGDVSKGDTPNPAGRDHLAIRHCRVTQIDPGRAARPRNPDSGHAGTISLTAGGGRGRWIGGRPRAGDGGWLSVAAGEAWVPVCRGFACVW